MRDIECVFSLRLNLNTFFSIFDDDADNKVTTSEIMEFGKKRNMQGMINLSGILLGGFGIQDYGKVRNDLNQERVIIFELVFG